VSSHYFRFSSLRAATGQRSRLLEKLLAIAEAPASVTDWRADAYRVIAPPMAAMPGVGAAALCADRGWVQAASVFVATPVHYVAEMSNVRLSADGILSVRQSEADALAVDFNRVWLDAGIRLLAGRHADLFCVADEPLSATTSDPEDVLDRHIDNHLPAGAAARPLRQLMSEIEMWLFEHAVNRNRAAEALPVVNGLWLWGGGAALAALPATNGWTAGNDVFFRAFTSLDADRCANSGVAVIAAQPGTDEWHDAAESRIEQSFADLRAGRIARIDLSAGQRCFSVSAHGRWRFWRRLRPWWESFA
jgi:hypothetical protein